MTASSETQTPGAAATATGGARLIKFDRHGMYLSSARFAIAELLGNSRIEALARETEPHRGALTADVVDLIDLLDALEAYAVDERERGYE